MESNLPKLMPLLSVLQYENENVISRFADEYEISLSDAKDIFLETKRWLWLCAKQKLAVDSGTAEFLQIPLFNEAKAIDLMWHCFILFTKDYADFCDFYFGFFIHHHPKPKKDKLAWREKIYSDERAARAERMENLKKVYSHLYDELGAEILKRWCEEFPARFSF